MNITGVWGVFSLTFRESIRARWLIIFSAIFFLLAINVPYIVGSQSHILPESYLATFLSILVSLAFPVIPLLALPMGATSIVDERESGTLQYVLSNPISKPEFFLGRAAGLTISTTIAVIAGFGGAAVVSYGADYSQYSGMVWLIGLALLLNAAMLGIGFVISELARRKITALVGALFVWLFFTAISGVQTLSIILNAMFGELAPVGLTLLDPIESARILTVMGLGYNDEQWGNLGLFAYDYFQANTYDALLISLILWVAVTFIVGFLIFRHQDIS